MKIAPTTFEKMISLDHLFLCWDQFKRGKHKRKDIQHFERHLEDHIFTLHEDLQTFQYHHGPYTHFYVFDPKKRYISKALVRDRLVHQMVYNLLQEVYERQFIFHSFSGRKGKGTHLGITHLHRMIKKASHNGKKPCYALKMDIKSFFDTIDHRILKNLIQQRIHDKKILTLIFKIIESFTIAPFKGLPIGNITSQILANIYLHEFDLFIKHILRESYYLRFCDDCLFLSQNKNHLAFLITPIRKFLFQNLTLDLHPQKLFIRKATQGTDFLGYNLFLKHRLVRTKTKKRLKRKLKKAYKSFVLGKIDVSSMDQKLQSYLGILSHAQEHTFSVALKNAYWVRMGQW